MEQNIRHRIELVCLKTLYQILRPLSYRTALITGAVLAHITYFFIKDRREEACRRIRFVFGESMEERRVKYIARMSWRNIFLNAVDFMKMNDFDEVFFDKIANFNHTISVFQNFVNRGVGGIISTLHMGSWELAATVCRIKGIPVFTFVAPQKNTFVTEWINNIRSGRGTVVISRGKDSLREVTRRLKNGGWLAILSDVRARTPALKIRFFGGIANIGSGMAAFSRMADVPVVPCVVTRKGLCRHEVYNMDPIFPDRSLSKEEDLQRITQMVMNFFDSAVRKEPEQWFWYNKRWILDPME